MRQAPRKIELLLVRLPQPGRVHSLSACRRCSERRPSRPGRAASSRPLPGRSASSAPATERKAKTEAVRSAPRCSYGRNMSSRFPPRRPPQRSSISSMTPSALAPTRKTTCVPGRVNLTAFSRRFISAAVRTCRSPTMTRPVSTGATVRTTLRARAARVAASESSSMNSLTRIGSRLRTPWVRRTSASGRLISSIAYPRLRYRTVPVLPPTPTFPDLSTPNASTAVLSRFRSSWAKNPRRSLRRAVSASVADWLPSRANSVTASAIASSRHAFSNAAMVVTSSAGSIGFARWIRGIYLPGTFGRRGISHRADWRTRGRLFSHFGAVQDPFSREDVERHFEREPRPIPN